MYLDFNSEVFSWVRGGLFLHIFTGELVDEIYGYLNFSLQFLAYAAYVAFARLLIETRANLIQWDKYLEIQTKILILLAGLFVLIPGISFKASKTRDRLFLNAEIMSFSISGLAFIAAIAAFCEMEHVPEVNWPCTLVHASAISFGAPI